MSRWAAQRGWEATEAFLSVQSLLLKNEKRKKEDVSSLGGICNSEAEDEAAL